ncbi:phiSA1p31-related protein [Streptomyces microflavus]|uniref:phiSA1p31-related protein n=1 Tax=Streptomyces microflavus TaxID=1919 RepID=UPI003B219E35
MRIELIDLEKMRLVVGLELDGTATVHTQGICDTRAAAALRDLADRMESGKPPCPCGSGVPTPTAVRQGWFASDFVWVDGSGGTWDLRVSYLAGGLLWHWTGRVDSQGAPLMGTGTGSFEQSLDVVRTLYAPVVVAGGQG